MRIRERRRYPRVKKNLPLKLRVGDFDVVTETENLSCIGTYCKVDRYVEPMTKLKILLLLPIRSRRSVVNKKVECEGIVVRSEPITDEGHRYNIAIFFSDIKTKDRERISDYVTAQLGNSEKT
jgi:hypothetical protein